MYQQLIHIYPTAPRKPAEGQACNGCGLCCLVEPCPIGSLVESAHTLPSMIQRTELAQFFDNLLQPERFRDYCPNGLQVEGKLEISTLVSGVTASLALIQAAIAHRADAIFVHHGLFWQGQDGRVTGWMQQRLKALLAHDINLFAYHLPLDAHPAWGNNVQLAKRLGWQVLEGEAGRFGEQGLGMLGAASYANATALADALELALQRKITLVQGHERPIRKIAWCTGGAQRYFEAAIAAGADAFVTGEISEPQAHCAREMGVAFLAAGHHATETLGAPAAAAHAAEVLGLKHIFIDVPNPA